MEKNGDYAACLKYSVCIFVEQIFKMERLEVSTAVRHIYMSLGFKRLMSYTGTATPFTYTSIVITICVTGYTLHV